MNTTAPAAHIVIAPRIGPVVHRAFLFTVRHEAGTREFTLQYGGADLDAAADAMHADFPGMVVLHVDALTA